MFTPVTDNPNCTMQREHFDRFPPIRRTAEHLFDTMTKMHQRGLYYSNWVGSLEQSHIRNTVIAKGPDYEPLSWGYDDLNIPWFTIWEYSWVLANSGVLHPEQKPLRILDLGGSSSVFDVALGLHGHHIVVVDKNEESLNNAKYNAEALGYTLEVIPADFQQLSQALAGQEGTFDCILSVSVLFFCDPQRHQILERNLFRYLKPGGLLAFSFDFLNPHPVRNIHDPVSYFNFRHLNLLPEGASFVDNKERHHLYRLDTSKGHYTAGALFFQRQK